MEIENKINHYSLAEFIFKETVDASIEGNTKCYVTYYYVCKAFETVWVDGLFINHEKNGHTWRLS